MPDDKQYMLRKAAGRIIKLDRDSFFDPRIFHADLILKGGQQIIVCNYKNNKRYALQHLILDAQKEETINHINRDPFDNRRCNQRVVNPNQEDIPLDESRG
ncbi:MAG: hypothetical protein ABSE89_04460 [Sedimentisphaerales bacterium]